MKGGDFLGFFFSFSTLEALCFLVPMMIVIMWMKSLCRVAFGIY